MPSGNKQLGNGNRTDASKDKDALYQLRKVFKNTLIINPNKQSHSHQHHERSQNQKVSNNNNNSKQRNNINPNITTSNKSKDNKVENDNNNIELPYKYDQLIENAVFKTSDRIIDDILIDLSFINSSADEIKELGLNKGILRLPTTDYSKFRSSFSEYKIINLSNKNNLINYRFEYESKTNHQDNKILEFFSILHKPKDASNLDYESMAKFWSQNEFYHLKVSIKTRNQLELSKKHTPIQHFYVIDEFNEEDKLDFINFNPDNPNLLDYAIFISSNTNKVVLVEIFKSEFNLNDKLIILDDLQVLNNYEKYKNSNHKLKLPTQTDVLLVLMYCFNKQQNFDNIHSSEDEIKLKDSKAIKISLNPSWLTERFSLKFQEDESLIFMNLRNNLNLIKKEKRRFDVFTRCLLELFVLIKSAPQKLVKCNSKDTNIIKVVDTISINSSLSFWSQILGEYKSILSQNNFNQYSKHAEFINLSILPTYTESEIVKNYEILTILNPDKIGVYFDSLKFVSQCLTQYENLADYVNKNEIIGNEEFNQSLKIFKMDKLEFTNCSDSVLWEKYLTYYEDKNFDYNHAILRNSIKSLSIVKNSPILKFLCKYEPYKNPDNAFVTLNIHESVDSDTIIVSYTTKINDMKDKKQHLDKALLTIAIDRKDLSLFHTLYENCKDFVNLYHSMNIEYKTALQAIDSSELNSDNELILSFKKRWYRIDVNNDTFGDDTVNLLTLRKVMMVISSNRNSLLLNNYIEYGIVNPKFLPSKSWPVGLNNIGNTCYLNSLLQYYFAISPLREYLINFNDIELDGREMKNLEKRRVGGRNLSIAEFHRSIQFVYQLRDLYGEMVHSSSRKVSPRLQLAYLAFAPSDTPIEFRDGIQNAIGKNDYYSDKTNGGSESSSIKGLNSNLNSDSDADSSLDSDSESSLLTFDNLPIIKTSTTNLPTLIPKISSSQLETTLEMGSQQDVTECIENVLFQIEAASNPISIDEDNEQVDLVKQLFFGKTEQKIKPFNEVSKVHPKRERFLSLLVSVSDKPRDIYDALDTYFKDEVFDMEEYGKVKKSLTISSFPTILQVQIQRVYYDIEKGVPFKDLEPLRFSESLYLDRYANDIDEKLAEKKIEVASLKKRLKGLITIKKELEKKNDNVEIRTISKEINDVETKIDTAFSEFHKHGYSLFAVFIHRGQATFGHYWIYIKDFKNHGTWRKYNDHEVTEILPIEVFNFSEGNSSTPYFLVYIKNGSEFDVEPLKREDMNKAQQMK
ncbi:hypothetical protein Kpol_1016p1 [Vanderwaltozyma polyspora DSM 70294]|uniref:ubiquitinyl hydrolase 1 n=1 Tax=Vanderwaltozyma polyspora (strain ATCC 22028 / DSM 70294 / BCRC 21397 / CBS 2163 / NBRC 10782 / NRRL Y-8283 / UCD 57-17) TaxID=436907 RepID=A7TNR9_VANPO|nr:uncharacterized protein Kpol_1016p1 [Vanderwaltozyma polyspora DSM 70294]EDO16062.1 hypothetical protein Kpol_1016p1 [Vanderwaltozyma polyspora DSM 70294]